MKLFLAIGFIMAVNSFVLCNAGCDQKGFYGENCENVCGYCVDEMGVPVNCSVYDGTCPNTCEKGYEGRKCDEPTCDPPCQNGGECIAPNMCFCGNDINLVKPSCEDIRIRGLMGSLIAIGVLSISILSCGYGSKAYKRSKKNRK